MYQQPAAGFRLLTFDFRLPTSDFRLPASNFWLLASSFQLPASSFKLPASSRAPRGGDGGNDCTNRSVRQHRSMRQHEGKMENVLCPVGKGARAVSAYLPQPFAITGSMMETSRYMGTRLTRTGTFRYERAVRLQATRWMAPVREALAVSLPFPATSFPF